MRLIRPALTVLALALATQARAAPGVDVIIESEAAFQAAVAQHGTRAGFLEFLADSAVVFSPDARPARAFYEGSPDSGERLRWRPDLAAISAEGDLGWASGPWLLWNAGSEQSDLAGHYVTVWRRTEGGLYAVVLDAGVSYALPTPDRARHLNVAARVHEGGHSRHGVGDCQEQFLARWREKGREKAVQKFAARDLRLLQSGRPPVDGRPAARSGDLLARLALEKGRVTRAITSTRGDLSVVYGEYDLALEVERSKRRYAYAAVWDAGGSCRLALEVTSPLP